MAEAPTPKREAPPAAGLEEAVARWLAGARERGELPTLEGRTYVTPAQALEGAGVSAKEQARHGTAIAEALGAAGWRRGRRMRVGSHKVTPYWAPAGGEVARG